jgi:hypothetical protein
MLFDDKFKIVSEGVKLKVHFVIFTKSGFSITYSVLQCIGQLVQGWRLKTQLI